MRDDISSLTESSLHAGDAGAERAADATEGAAEVVGNGLKRNGSGVIRNRQARVATAVLQKRAKNLERFAKAMKVAGYAIAASESVENFMKCEESQ